MKWSQRWHMLGLLAALGSGSGPGCGFSEDCDPEAVTALESLPPFEGVSVDLHGSPGIGCTDTVKPADPDAFVAHYQKAMRHAGWGGVAADDSGVFGKGPVAGVRIDFLEGDGVGVYLLSPDDY